MTADFIRSELERLRQEQNPDLVQDQIQLEVPAPAPETQPETEPETGRGVVEIQLL